MTPALSSSASETASAVKDIRPSRGCQNWPVLTFLAMPGILEIGREGRSPRATYGDRKDK